MAEGTPYEDEAESEEKSKPSTSKSTPSRQQLKLSEPYNWIESDLNQYVEEGTMRKDDSTLEHVALHPYWLSNPLNGVKEELEGFLGKWRPSMNGYLVAVKKIRLVKSKQSRFSQVGFMYQDQPWIHLDAGATFYLYTPIVGQKLTGTVMKLGRNAAICVFFKCFSASVFPPSEGEFAKWNLGDELVFEITSFQNRRRGPMIRATSVRHNVHKPLSLDVKNPFEEDWCAGDTPAADQDSISITSAKKPNRHVMFNSEEPDHEEHGICEEPSPLKKKKKHRHKKDNFDESSDRIRSPTHVPSELTPDPPPKQKHKSKRFPDLEQELPKLPDVWDDDEPIIKKKKHKVKHEQLDAQDEEPSTDRKRSKKHRQPSAGIEIATDLFENSDESPRKKKKKKHG